MKYYSTQQFTKEEFLNEPDEVPMVRVLDENNMIIAVVTPEEFESRYVNVNQVEGL